MNITILSNYIQLIPIKLQSIDFLKLTNDVEFDSLVQSV